MTTRTSRSTSPSTTPFTTPLSAVTGRLDWVDVAKGACILLVVLHHASTKNLLVQLPADLAWVADGWFELSTALKPIRMPLFFVLSGLVAAPAVHRPWRVARRRVLGPAWLHLVWLPVLVLVLAVEPTLPANRLTGPGAVALDLLWASTSLWFLYALAAYFVLVKLVAGLPRVPVLLVLTAVAATASYVPTEHWNRFSVVFHVVFFAVGALAPDLVHALVRWVSRVPLPVAVGAYVLTWWALDAVLPAEPVSVLLLLAAVVGVPMGLRAALAVRGRPARGLAWLGRRTLPVYVLHLPLLAVAVHLPLAAALAAVADAPDLGGPLVAAVAAWLAPVVLAAAVVPLTLLAHRALLRAGATWLFAAPAWLEPALDRLAGLVTGLPASLAQTERRYAPPTSKNASVT
ncbi:acyltransferase [Nocardioides sp. GY 10127]|uniref:acyltransferase family protein n=1 Tax=Nocardioides sp. GY 10127 TaxID=2569762 RepID=UPI0010A94944|nr:acyltransferase [Nocardioides sp. GY 10127]TIC79373.1 acyltransferase [Nocardioides sp. GY 10127]